MPPPYKSEKDILASASFADRQLEHDTLKSLQLKVIMSFLSLALPTLYLPFMWGRGEGKGLVTLSINELSRQNSGVPIRL